MSQNPDKPHSSEGKLSGLEDGQEESLDNPDQSIRKRIRQSAPGSHTDDTPKSSPPRPVSVEELMETAKGVTNMALAHEIVVNGDFQIKPAELPEHSLEKKVRDIVHKAFWDCLEAQLKEDPPTYDHAIKLLGEIKENLLSFLLPGHTRLRSQITEVLDLDLIKQEAENGALDISKLVEFVIGMMGTLCAPARDEEIKKLKDINEIVPLFRAIFSVLDLMKMDMANFAVSSIRPKLMQQSAEYERKKFQEFLEKQPNSLDLVTRWLQEAADDLAKLRCRALPLRCSGDGAAGGAAALCPTAVQNQAYLKLLKWDHVNRPFPETVLMDQSRFQEIQLELEQLLLTGTVLLVTFSAAGSALVDMPGFAEKIKTVVKVLLAGMHLPSFNLQESLATIGEKVCAEVNSCLSRHGFTPLSAERETGLKGQIQAVADPDNTIRRLIDSRIEKFLENYLASSHQRSLPAVPGGLGPVQRELEEVAVNSLVTTDEERSGDAKGAQKQTMRERCVFNSISKGSYRAGCISFPCLLGAQDPPQNRARGAAAPVRQCGTLREATLPEASPLEMIRNRNNQGKAVFIWGKRESQKLRVAAVTWCVGSAEKVPSKGP